MSEPSELSISEIHSYFLKNNYKVTNTQLVKHFRKFLTGPAISEARKQFKTYVNILATIKSEGSEKYLILRKKYYNEVPSEDSFMDTSACMSPVSMVSMSSDFGDSPSRLPPPYRAPPQFSSAPSSPSIQQPVPASMTTVGLPILEAQTKVQYKDCVNEFQQAMTNFLDSNRVDVASRKNSFEQIIDEQTPPSLPPRKRTSIDHRSISRENSIEQTERDDNKENIQSPESAVSPSSAETDENKISVREAMKKFNRYASEEEAKIPSPLSKSAKKQEKTLDDTTGSSESLTNHPKAKEWMLAAARANYQELAKLASEHPQLVGLHDPNTGYTALHWAAKHGNENVIKLIAGSLKADVNCRTNGGYTALHLAMQFGRNDIFELLCNVYRADRDVLDWSGKKPLDYQKQLTSISASTFSKIKSRKKHSEKDNSFLRIGSLRIGNLLGVNTKLPQTHHHQQIRSSAPLSAFEMKMHKSWGSADNVSPQSNQETMGPPKFTAKKRRQKRDLPDSPSNPTECHSMPTTPNLEGRHKDMSSDHDSDTAYGFDSNNWGA